jgi:hypothetical protein
MANPPQGSDVLQGHWTLPLFATMVYGNMRHGAPQTTSQVRLDYQAGSNSTTYVTEIDYSGIGVVTALSTNPNSIYSGAYRLTIDGVVLIDGTVSAPGDWLIGMIWLVDIKLSCIGPLFFRDSFKLESKRVSPSFPFYWNCIYTKMAW